MINFKLELDIIEIYESNYLTEKQYYYISLLKCKYNILKKARSFLRSKHNKDIIKGISYFKLGCAKIDNLAIIVNSTRVNLYQLLIIKDIK